MSRNNTLVIVKQRQKRWFDMLDRTDNSVSCQIHDTLGEELTQSSPARKNFIWLRQISRGRV